MSLLCGCLSSDRSRYGSCAPGCSYQGYTAHSLGVNVEPPRRVLRFPLTSLEAQRIPIPKGSDPCGVQIVRVLEAIPHKGLHALRARSGLEAESPWRDSWLRQAEEQIEARFGKKRAPFFSGVPGQKALHFSALLLDFSS